MGSLLFAFGSAVGAAVAWLVVRGHPHWSTGFALNGIACGLLGALLSATRDTNVPAIIEAGFGLLTTAAPLTLCMSGSRAPAGHAGAFSAGRNLAATLALALVSGVSCATVGFMLVESVRQISVKESTVKPSGDPIILSLRPFHAPSPALRGGS